LLPRVDTIKLALPEKHNNMKLNNINRKHQNFVEERTNG